MINGLYFLCKETTQYVTCTEIVFFSPHVDRGLSNHLKFLKGLFPPVPLLYVLSKIMLGWVFFGNF